MLIQLPTPQNPKSYTADSYDAVLAAVKEEYAGNALVNKVPDSIEAALTNNTVSAVFNAVLAQINASMTEYKLDLTPASVAEVVSGMYGVVVYGAVDSGNVTGVTAAMADGGAIIGAGGCGGVHLPGAAGDLPHAEGDRRARGHGGGAATRPPQTESINKKGVNP